MVPGRSFQHSLMGLGKARNLPYNRVHFSRVGSGLTGKHQTRQVGLTRDRGKMKCNLKKFYNANMHCNHKKFYNTNMNYGQKKFYNVGPWGQCYKTFSVRDLWIFVLG
jgi:hypothetical protein